MLSDDTFIDSLVQRPSQSLLALRCFHSLNLTSERAFLFPIDKRRIPASRLAGWGELGAGELSEGLRHDMIILKG